MSTDTEKQLVARCRRGEAEAWDTLFDEHYAAVGRFVFQLSPDLPREDIEEICQEVFLSVVRNLRAFNCRARLQTWLFRIAVNKTRDFIDKQRAAKRGGGVVARSLQAEDPETGLAMQLPSPDRQPDHALVNTEKLFLIGRALEELGGTSCRIIQLRYFGGLTYEEIAAALDISPKTVSSSLSKGLLRLGAILRRLSAGEKPALAAA
jgi:RNA polymerase sigma-70 factor, ECF subfamily